MWEDRNGGVGMEVWTEGIEGGNGGGGPAGTSEDFSRAGFGGGGRIGEE